MPSTLHRELWQLVWPLLLLGVLRTGTLLVDSWFVGFLGTRALAAMGGCAFVLWILGSLAEIAGTGTQALVARSDDRHLQRAIGGAGVLVALGVAASVLALRPLEALYCDLLSFDGLERVHALAYLDPTLLGAGSLLLQAALVGVYRGLGDMRAAMLVAGLSLLANMVLDPVFLFLLDGGMAGLAWATVLANGLGLLVALVDQLRRRIAPTFPDALARVRPIVAIGLPLAAQGVAFTAIYVLLGMVTAPYGSAPMAALGLGHRIESLPYMVCLAFEMAAPTLVGRRIGAGDLLEARRAGGVAARTAALAMLPLGLLLFVGAEASFRVFHADLDVVRVGAPYVRLQALVWWAMAYECVITGAAAGAGRTTVPVLINGVLTALRVPLAVLGAAWLGVDGIWAAIALSTFLKGSALGLWWRRVPLG